jgi:hypothetical protein
MTLYEKIKNASLEEMAWYFAAFAKGLIPDIDTQDVYNSMLLGLQKED